MQRFGAFQLVTEMLISSAQPGSVRPKVPVEKPQVGHFLQWWQRQECGGVG